MSTAALPTSTPTGRCWPFQSACPPASPDLHPLPLLPCPHSSAIPVVTCVLAILVESRYPSRQELTALITLTLGVMLAVWQGTVSGKPYAIAFCLVGTVCNGAMMTFSGKLLRCGLQGGWRVGVLLHLRR